MRTQTARRPRTSRTARCLVVFTFAAVLVAGMATPAAAHAPGRYLEIDISEQVLAEVVDGYVTFSTQISSGNGEWYWYQGGWALAETPRGWFEIYAKDAGWWQGSLGWLYNAMYFYGGFAIHGSYSVPDYPASHGCVRVTIGAADELFHRTPLGTPVFVHD